MVQHLNWVTYSCNWETILIQMKNTTGVDFSLLSTNSVCSFCYDHVDHIIMHSTALTTNLPPPPLLRIHGTHYIWIKQPLPHFEFLRILPLMIFSEQVRRDGFVRFSGHKHIWSEVEIYWFQALILEFNWLSFILNYGSWKRKNWKVIYGITYY